MNNLSGDLMDSNSLFGLSYELMADIVPLLVVALAAVTILFLLFRLKPINIPAVVLYVFSVVGISLDLTSGNNISSVYLPKWFIFLIGQLSYSLLVGVFIWIVFSYYSEKKRTAIYKKRLSDAYDSFRKNVVRILLSATKERHDSNLEKELLDYKNFKNYFGGDNRKRRDSILNQLSDETYSHRHDLLIEFELLQREISYILNSNILPNEKSYNHLCIMSGCIVRRKLDYDNIISKKSNFNESNFNEIEFNDFDKFFIGEIFSILSQRSLISGQLKKDPIRETIEKI